MAPNLPIDPLADEAGILVEHGRAFPGNDHGMSAQHDADAHGDGDKEPAGGIDRWGIQRRWLDADGEQQTVSEETVRSLRAAIGEPAPHLDRTGPVVTRRRRSLGNLVSYPVEVTCEDGSEHKIDGPDGTVPDDMPYGYHRLRDADGHDRRLIVSPGRCWLPESGRAWGWTVQLYAARSRTSWGIGDLADLRALREWSQSLGSKFMLVNPLHAVAPTSQQEASPYLPVTRRFRNPIYLAVADVPGADGVDLTDLTAAGHNLDRDRLIDRDTVWRLKIAALERIFGHERPPAEFDDWRDEQGPDLERYATWAALAELHGGHWPHWDEQLHDPDGPAVAAFAVEHAERVTFHAWLQWLLDRQLREATADLNVIQDLPIGVSGGGADAWAWQDTVASGVSVGAPPDLFSAKGQDWGSPPLIPWRLKEHDYEPFIASIRATMAGAGGVRIDHVMGLFRLWWVPQDAADPRGGAYVRYPSEDLLDIVALESHRARALVVGEDLGVVEPGVRETLAEHDILSYKLLWFEPDDPATWTSTSLAAITTHDLPTVAGVWTGSDLEEQAACTDVPEADLVRGRDEMVARLRDGAEVAGSARVEEAVRGAHRLLARASSMLVSATLGDAVAEPRRPNIPGAATRDNWSLALPVLVDDLPDHPVARSVAEELGRHGR